MNAEFLRLWIRFSAVNNIKWEFKLHTFPSQNQIWVQGQGYGQVWSRHSTCFWKRVLIEQNKNAGHCCTLPKSTSTRTWPNPIQNFELWHAIDQYNLDFALHHSICCLFVYFQVRIHFGQQQQWKRLSESVVSIQKSDWSCPTPMLTVRIPLRFQTNHSKLQSVWFLDFSQYCSGWSAGRSRRFCWSKEIFS